MNTKIKCKSTIVDKKTLTIVIKIAFHYFFALVAM
jgi:hypothetical protein